MMAVSVLPLSTTYAITEACGFERGLNKSIKEAPFFYGTFAAIILISLLVVLIPGISYFPIMIASQVLNAVLLPAILILILKMANDEKIMGKYKNSKLTNILAWAITALIIVVTIIMLIEPFLKF